MSGIIGVSPDMRSGVVGAFPAGHVVQVVSATSTTAFDHAGSSYDSSYKFETTITPKYSNSKIWAYITGTWNVYAGNTNVNKLAFLALFEGTISTIRVHTRVGLTFSAATGMDAYGPIALQYFADAGTAGAAQTFGVCSKTNGGSYNNSIRIGESSYPTLITLMEIKV
jgi:purine-cytosine permease-like protein